METEREKSRGTALVTGGSRGIGRAICLRLAGAGFDVVFNYQSGEEAARETEALCRQKGVYAEAVRADIRLPEDCRRLTERALQVGNKRIEVLVNNAGITRDGLLIGMKDEDLEEVLNVNLKGCFYMMRAVARPMLRQRSGRIVNISSVSGILGNAGQVNYAASKAAVIGMTKSLARELASRHITVNAVAPGMIATDMTRSMPEAAREALLRQIPLGEPGRPEDVAEAVAFLAGEGGRYITGQVLCVDGGMAI